MLRVLTYRCFKSLRTLMMHAWFYDAGIAAEEVQEEEEEEEEVAMVGVAMVEVEEVAMAEEAMGVVAMEEEEAWAFGLMQMM